jgi:hypothetical protein
MIATEKLLLQFIKIVKDISWDLLLNYLYKIKLIEISQNNRIISITRQGRCRIAVLVIKYF